MSQPSRLQSADAEVGKVLVTGGSGFLGQALVRRLVDQDATVRVLTRSERRAEELSSIGAEPLVGDVTDRAAVGAALEQVTVVYHLAGKLLEPGQPAIDYRNTHVEGTKIVIDYCSRLPSLRRFVHCSTTGVLGPTGDTSVSEEAPMRWSNVYEETKAEAELGVRAEIERGFPGVIVRPGLVYGPGDWHLVKFYEAILRRRFRPIGRRDVWFHPIYIDDMTDAFLLCGTDRRAVGHCFNVAGEEPVSLARLADTIARAGGTTLPRGRIPLAAGSVLAAACDALPTRLRERAPLPRSRLDFLTHSRVYDVSKIRRVLDFSAATDLETGIARTMEWYLNTFSMQPPSRAPLAAAAN